MFSLLSHRPARSSRRNVCLHLEALEDRSVPSVLGDFGPAPAPNWFSREDVGSSDALQTPAQDGLVGATSYPAGELAGLMGADDPHDFIDDDWSAHPNPSPWVKRWMSHIPDNKYLSELNIPGTHDSGTEPLWLWARTQAWHIQDQLNAGIRFLDIRVGHVDDTYLIYHDKIKVPDLTFQNVLDTCYKFLDDNPSETIIMSFKKDYGNGDHNNRTFIKTFQDYRDGNTAKWYTGSTVPKLKDVRGKIVLVAREPGIGGIPWDHLGNMNIQDDWNGPLQSIKWGQIREHLEGAISSSYRQWFINFCSANGFSGVEYYAGHMNGELYKLLPYKTGRLGTILLDFPGVKLVERIILSNVRIMPLGLPSFNEDWNVHSQYYLPNREFVSMLFTNLLGRSGSDKEVEGWVNKLQSGTKRLDVFKDFIGTAEYRHVQMDRQVDYFFRTYLGREASETPAGKQDYIDRLAKGDSVKDIMASILASGELKDKLGKVDWVKHLYRSLLAREPSDGETQDWVGQFNFDYDSERERVVWSFLNSEEFRKIFPDGTYADLLDREVDQFASKESEVNSQAEEYGVNSQVVGALLGQPIAVGTAQLAGQSVTASVRDLAFLPQQGNAPLAAVGSMFAVGGGDEATTADVQGILFGDRDGDGVRSDGEPRLSDRVVRLVDDDNAVVAETTTGADGAYRFVEVPAGRYQVETESGAEWAGATSPAFTVGAEPVWLDPLALPSATHRGAESALPAKDAAPAAKVAAASNADAVWMLLGAALPAVQSRKVRRTKAPAVRRGAY
jgi:1-phosphatidylinositol phosphodiesterase